MRRPPRSTRTDTLFPYTTRCRSGELLDGADTVSSMERAGFEVRDVEALREHYALTLRAWVANLEQHWDDAVALVGVRRARVWRLYMAASAIGFEDGGLGVSTEERRVGKECVSKCRTEWSPCH